MDNTIVETNASNPIMLGLYCIVKWLDYMGKIPTINGLMLMTGATGYQARKAIDSHKNRTRIAQANPSGPSPSAESSHKNRTRIAQNTAEGSSETRLLDVKALTTNNLTSKATTPPCTPPNQKLANPLPGVIEDSVWNDWIQYKKEKKSPLTPVGVTRQKKLLLKYKSEGHEPNDVINYTIAQGYAGLFPNSDFRTGNQPSEFDKTAADIEEMTRKVARERSN